MGLLEASHTLHVHSTRSDASSRPTIRELANVILSSQGRQVATTANMKNIKIRFIQINKIIQESTQIAQSITYPTMSVFSQNAMKGKLALISGGGTGICYGISKQFLLHGAKVYIISRKIDNVNNGVARLKKQTGKDCVYGSACDVRDEKTIQQTIKKIVQEHGKINVLVNGAAGNFLCPFESLSKNAFTTVLMIDTVGTFLLSKYVNQYCFDKGGIIINITASLHYNGTALQSHAGTAKAGVDALTKHMAVELGPKGVRVNGICPGIIQATEGFSKLKGNSTEEDMIGYLPIKRLGKPEDIANCAVFLCTDAASYITGTTIPVDGGQLLTTPNFPFSDQTFRKSYAKPKL